MIWGERMRQKSTALFFWSFVCLVSLGATGLVTPVQAQTKKPNIIVIWGDDVGWSNVSAYNMGMMGYRTPNIDRIANEGMLFTEFLAKSPGPVAPG